MFKSLTKDLLLHLISPFPTVLAVAVSLESSFIYVKVVLIVVEDVDKIPCEVLTQYDV